MYFPGCYTGHIVAGTVFFIGWYIWVDAVVYSCVTVPFDYYLPGIFASLAALMINCVRKEDIDHFSYGEGEWSLIWLSIACFVVFVSLYGSTTLMIQASWNDPIHTIWTGIASVLQCVCVLISGLVYWVFPSHPLQTIPDRCDGVHSGRAFCGCKYDVAGL